MEENTISATDEERDKEYENLSPECGQWNENELLVVNLPTSNSFSQEPPTKPLTNGSQDLGQDKQNRATSTSTASNNNNNNNNTSSNEAIFLCDSNGKLMDTKQMFSSKLEVKYTRTPLIEYARNYVQNRSRTPPQMILLHKGTNALDITNSAEELVSNILMITEASTKFPSSKILFSTLLLR